MYAMKAHAADALQGRPDPGKCETTLSVAIAQKLAGLTAHVGHGGMPSHLSPPTHRWEIASSIVTKLATRCTLGHAIDQAVEQAIQFLTAHQTNPAKADDSFPHLSAAVRLRFQADKLTRALVEARLLTGEAMTDTAEKCNLSFDAVRWYALLFCDVADKLQHRHYIVSQAISPRYWSGYTEDDVDILLKSLAYLKGPVFLDYLLPYFMSPCHIPDRLDTFSLPDLERVKYFASAKAMITALTLPKVNTLPPGVKGSPFKPAIVWRALGDELALAIAEEAHAAARQAVPATLSTASCRYLLESFSGRTRANPVETTPSAGALAG
jgi:hypothetical protein